MAGVTPEPRAGVPKLDNKWFKKANSNENSREPIKPADEAFQDRDSFKTHIQSLFKRKEKNIRFVSTEQELRDQLELLTTDDLSKVVNTTLTVARRQNSFYNNERTQGPKQLRRKLQNFAKTFSDFLGAYGGIVELVKNAGQQYGELAYETLSIFLVVIVHKCQNDEQITKLLADLQVAFPQLETLLGVYPSIKLQEHVASVYREVIIFARDTARYFAKQSVRYLSAIASPPSRGISNTTMTINRLLAAVGAEAMVLLHCRNQAIDNNVQQLQEENKLLLQRMEELERQNNKLIQQNSGLISNVETVKQESHLLRESSDFNMKQGDDDNLERMRECLDLAPPTIEIDIKTCKQAVLDAFPDESTSHRRKCTKYERMTPELLDTCVMYKQWCACETSALLYLCGPTDIESRLEVTTHSWLSPAASFMAERVLLEKGTVSAYYCCHPDIRAERKRATTVISALIYRLLCCRPSILRGAQIRSRFYGIAMQCLSTKDDGEAIKMMMQLLREVLVELNKSNAVETTYIILDRVDQCSIDRCHFPVDRLMNQILKLVLDPDCKVKIMVICDSSFSAKSMFHKEEDTLKHDRVYIEEWLVHKEVDL